MSSARVGRATAALLLFLLAAPEARAQMQPPDPRLGERLDGRSTPVEAGGALLLLPRLVLSVPRVGAQLLLWPVVRSTEVVEDAHLYGRVYWALTSEDELVGLRPELRISSDFQTAMGLRLFDHRTLGAGSLLQPRFRLGTSGGLFGELEVEKPVAEDLVLAIRAVGDRQSDALFAGLDGVPRDELVSEGRGRARYAYDRGALRLEARRALPAGMFLTLRGEYDRRRYASERASGADPKIADRFCAHPGTADCMNVDEALVPGFARGVDLARGGVTFGLDTRRWRRYSDGFSAILGASASRGVAGDPSRHAAYLADVRRVFDLHDRALVIRGIVGMVEPMGDAPVPFDELLSPTGTDGLRGLPLGRLRGHSEAVGSVEYRWILATYLDATMFMQYGGVFGRVFDGFAADKLIPCVGGGIRAYWERDAYWAARLLGNLQVAWAPNEGLRVLLTASED